MPSRIADGRISPLRGLSFMICAALAIAGACSGEVAPPTDTSDDIQRTIRVSTDSESFGEILENGNRPTDISRYSIRYLPKAGFTPYFKGSNVTKIVTGAFDPVAGSIECFHPGTDDCGRFPFFDGYQTQEAATPDMWNGQWTAELTVRQADGTTKKCSIDFGFNHLDRNTSNGTFFDIHAGDQKIRFNVSSTGTCSATFITGGLLVRHPIPSTRLVANYPPGTPSVITGYVGDSFTAQAAPTGGFGSYKYAWKVVPEGDPAFLGPSFDFSGADFVTQNTKTVTFSQPGRYHLRYLVRDGNDVDGHGGNYALSSPCIFDIATRPQLGATAVGHSLPGTATQYVWYATSVTLKNVGTQTWSGSTFSVGQMPSQYWSPSTMGLGSGSVATNQSRTFNFNEGMMGNWLGYRDNYWKIRQSGVAFGDAVGRVTYVKTGSEPPPEASRDWGWFGALAAGLGPRVAFADVPFPDLRGDVVQRVEVRDFPLPKDEIAATGVFPLRYETALAEPWDVDFLLEVEYDPAIFEVGAIERGARGGSHVIKLDVIAPGRLLVLGQRIGRSKMEGQGLVFEVPLVLKEGATIPDTFPSVVLTAVQ